MLKFEEGKTYICTETYESWWTRGKEYKVFSDTYENQFVINDDEGTPWRDYELRMTRNKFKLKEENKMTITVCFDNPGKECTLKIYEDIETYYINDDFIKLITYNNQTTIYVAKEHLLTMEVN